MFKAKESRLAYPLVQQHDGTIERPPWWCTRSVRREAYFLNKLPENSSFKASDMTLIKHEFIMSIWLPEKGFDISLHTEQRRLHPIRAFDDG